MTEMTDLYSEIRKNEHLLIVHTCVGMDKVGVQKKEKASVASSSPSLRHARHAETSTHKSTPAHESTKGTCAECGGTFSGIDEWMTCDGCGVRY